MVERKRVKVFGAFMWGGVMRKTTLVRREEVNVQTEGAQMGQVNESRF